jgi:hypothetical protein
MYEARDENDIRHVMDAIQATVTTASVPTPIQFLQAWMTGFVRIVTAARKIDQLVGIQVIGSWEDEEIVQPFIELVGSPQPYGDSSNTNFSSWNVNFLRRTIVPFQDGMEVGRREELRAARVRVNSAESKRESSALQLEILRNAVGFNGYNSGLNRTYGFLNDPNLPNYVNVATGVIGLPWSTKNFQEITKDIRTGAAAIQNNSKDLINPEDVEITLAVATAAYQYLSVMTDQGISVRQWIKETYPKMRIVSAPELNGANGGANVFYMYAEKLDDSSTDDGRVFAQMVPTKFMVLGVQQKIKTYEEAYSNALAGVLCKRPFAVVRYSGI